MPDQIPVFRDNSVDNHIDRQRVQLCLDRTVEKGGGCEVHEISQSSQSLCNRAKEQMKCAEIQLQALKFSREHAVK